MPLPIPGPGRPKNPPKPPKNLPPEPPKPGSPPPPVELAQPNPLKPEPPSPPSPKPEALRNPPPPEMPRRKVGRPSKVEQAAREQAKAEEARRLLPSDPAELDRVLAPLKVEFSSITDLVDVLCSILPPKMAMRPEEREALTTAGARVLYVYGANVSPWWGLALVAGGISVPRYVLYKRGVLDVNAPAKETIVEVKP
jgi:hypothetical protein